MFLLHFQAAIPLLKFLSLIFSRLKKISYISDIATEMKRLVILIIALVWCSSAYADLEKARESHGQSLGPYHKTFDDRINSISFPFDATLAILHQSPTVAGGQNRYDPDRNLKLVSSTFSGLSVWPYEFLSYRDHWERKNKMSVLRFILFRNLRL